MDIGDEQEGGVDRLDAAAGLSEGAARQNASRGKASRLAQETAAGQECRGQAIHHRPIEHSQRQIVQIGAPWTFSSLG
ncbi:MULTISPECIES: hypothetical protein [unclassified Mesorhizobium]|uniref:hypothetical protein n=1 Tax=unclassified Mesorhizobium TaxID=325217 RepID=UPI001FDFF6E3|nr:MULTISPECIES: hypothetical protein [unclassified Mesorhizobium]